ncbi:hypothetical protein RJ640_010881 [Escallonia rubra]|uniref:Response regulatory domain-containing protein n=1 Tax=Escallonia rubra TaxID=112253 RepID=A0AA88U5R8_9ASTE|nr:hypothetical protein RJ640_010881 [Escallonia rubra]
MKKVCLVKIEGQYDSYRLLYARDDRLLHENIYSAPPLFGHKQESSILKEVPVVIMSSENIPTRINKCLQEGAQMFMLKPLKQADVKKLRGQLMKHRN